MGVFCVEDFESERNIGHPNDSDSKARQIFGLLADTRDHLELARSELAAEERLAGIGTPLRPGDIRQPGHGDPTASAASRLSDARDRVTELERRISEIEGASFNMLRAVPVARWEFVARCRCLYGWDMQAIANEAKVSKRTAYSYLRKALEWMDASGASAEAFERLFCNARDSSRDCTELHDPA